MEDLTVARDDYQGQLEKVKRGYDQISRKYSEALSTNLALSRKTTQANEDYLTLAQQKQALEQKIKQMRNMGKKIVRVKV